MFFSRVRVCRELLSEVRFGQAFSVEDLENAYSELCFDEVEAGADPMKLVNSAKVHWYEFQAWYNEYFLDR